jgi:methylated-DNA-protein-cysteine methyltransferase-like protein
MSEGFFQAVYAIVRRIPKGKVATYGQIARLAGRPRSAKVVGWALHCNPQPGIIPCHRVVDRNGCLSISFAFGGINQQKILLENEGIIIDESGKINLNQYQWADDSTISKV